MSFSRRAAVQPSPRSTFFCRIRQPFPHACAVMPDRNDRLLGFSDTSPVVISLAARAGKPEEAPTPRSQELSPSGSTSIGVILHNLHPFLVRRTANRSQSEAIKGLHSTLAERQACVIWHQSRKQDWKLTRTLRAKGSHCRSSNGKLMPHNATLPAFPMRQLDRPSRRDPTGESAPTTPPTVFPRRHALGNAAAICCFLPLGGCIEPFPVAPQPDQGLQPSFRYR